MNIFNHIHPAILKIVIAASVALGVLAGFGTWQYLKKQPVRPASDSGAKAQNQKKAPLTPPHGEVVHQD